jgi:hypothetical protein
MITLLDFLLLLYMTKLYMPSRIPSELRSLASSDCFHCFNTVEGTCKARGQQIS